MPSSRLLTLLETLADARDVQSDTERCFFTPEDVATCLNRAAVPPGGLVLITQPNGVALLNIFFGVLQAGAVPALLPPLLPVGRLRYLASSLQAAALIDRREILDMMQCHSSTPVGRIALGLLPIDLPPATTAGEVVLLTSGTSGIASACVFDFEQLLTNAIRHGESVMQTAEDRVLVSLPLYFSFALVAQALTTLATGGRLFISGPPFHPPSYLRALRSSHISISSLTPRLVRALPAMPDWGDTLRALTVGGDAIAAGKVSALLSSRPNGQLYLTYGLTQAGPRVSTLAAHAVEPARYASVGKPLRGTRVALRDADSTSELCVKSSTLMKRHIGILEGRSRDVTNSGWLLTGDSFHQDDEGYLFFRDRLTDFTVAGGEKISLASVRRLASEVAGVLAVRTFPRDSGSEMSAYDLCLSVDASCETDVVAEVADRLRKFLRAAERPQSIRLVEECPEMAHK